MEGNHRVAVEVISWDKTPFFLDDVTGDGWRKVTDGQGDPMWGHSSLPGDSVVVDVLYEPLGYPKALTL